MKNSISIRVCFSLLVFFILAPCSVHALPGDADGNGTVDIEDARIIARFVANQIPGLPSPTDADATQDGMIDMEDAFIIAKWITGETRIVVAAPRHGRSDRLQIGNLIRIEVFEKFFPFHITGGTVRIVSSSTNYDSGDKSLIFNRDGRSLYYHWNTTGLTPANDFVIQVNLTDNLNSSSERAFAATVANQLTGQTQTSVELVPRWYEPHMLAETIDAYCAAPGLPLIFKRLVNNDSSFFPYLGPLGRGWTHNYDLNIEEFTDGRVEFHGPQKISRFFQSNPDGTYSADPGDYGTLTRDPNGQFQLKEKSGMIYRFRSDLRLDYMEDLNNNRISAIYDQSGNLIEIRHSCGSSFFLEYNEFGRIIRLTDHAGRTTDYEYDIWPAPPVAPMNLSFLHNHILTKVTNSDGEETLYTHSLGQSNNMNYRLISVQHPDGTFDHYEHDADTYIRQTGTWGANPITYAYEANGVTRITDAVGGETLVQVNDKGLPVATTSPDDAVTRIQYDSANNPLQITDPLNRATTQIYDEFGNTTHLTNPLDETVTMGYDLRFHMPAWITDPLNHTVSYSYDDHGNLITTTFPDNSQENFSYDIHGNMIKYTDPESKHTNYSYNANGQVTATENALGYVTSFAYNSDGNLARVTDAKGYEITFEYDILDRLKKQVFPDGSSENYTFYAGGKIKTFANRRGDIINFSYDIPGRLAYKEYPSGRSFGFKYDYRGIIYQVDKTTGGNTSLDAYYEYDLSRRLTLAKVPGKTDSETYDVSYTYGKADNRISMNYPDGITVTYHYDDADRLIRIADAGDGTLVAYDYDAAGRIILRTLGNDTYTTYNYDDLNRLISMINYAPDNAVQSRFDYTYNAAGIRQTMTNLEGIHIYTYDDAYQLIKVEYPDGRVVSYSFDASGNRVSVTDDGQLTSYSSNILNQYTQFGSESFTYDMNGNLATRSIGGQITQYTWDEENRLVAVNKEGTHIDYSYDHQGRLSAKVINGQKTRFVWDDMDLIAQIDANGQIVKRIIYGNAIDEVVLVATDVQNHWCQQDGLGSVIATTNDRGNVRANCAYDVYGKMRSGSLGPVPQRLAGMWWDEDAGLYHIRARWYDPMIGRFIQPDPAGILGGINLYSYVLNDPVNLIDPEGQANKLKKQSTGKFRKNIHQNQFAHSSRKISKAKARLMKLKKWKPMKGALRKLSGKGGFLRTGGFNSNLLRAAGRAANAALAIWFAAEMGWEAGKGYGSLPGAPGGQTIGEFWGQRLYNLLYGGEVGYFTLTGEFVIGGTCPTFIQLPLNSLPAETSRLKNISKRIDVGNLHARIMIPIDNVMLRSDIPIFGKAGGKNFKSYRVEYGIGKSPEVWHLIAESRTPQDKSKIGLAEMRLMQGDLNLRGNLATLNTGLKNWVHLPWHSPEDSTDFNGVYTIRLVVEGKNGDTEEDRVTGEVGRVIAQCLPGVAVSPDHQVSLSFPEQAINHPFRIYTILPLTETGETIPDAPDGGKYVGPVYRIREPGDRFIKDVTLTFDLGEDGAVESDHSHMGIANYDSENQKWVYLPTRYDQNKHRFSTILKGLPAPKAIYALILNPEEKMNSLDIPVSTKPANFEPVQPGMLVNNTFENGLGTFKPRDGFVGARLFRDNRATADGSFCLKFENANFGGNFASTIMDAPFDVREYGTMTFDYRIDQQTKIDFFLKVNGRWYNLGFTGDPVDFCQRDVNIANMGMINGIIPDDKWHAASVDLQYLLRQQTRHTKVDAIVMANWDVGGYMKLEFGKNPRGATYYLDNFKLTGPGQVQQTPPVLLVDKFNEVKSKNSLGGAFGTFSTPGSNSFKDSLIDVAPGSESPAPSASDNRNRALLLTFDTTKPDAYGGYWTSIAGSDLSNYLTLAFRMHTDGDVPPMTVGIRDSHGIEGKTDLRPYAAGNDGKGWREVRIPLSGLRGLSDFSSPDVLFFSTTYREQSGKGTIRIDDLRFEQTVFTTVTNFEPFFHWSLLGGDFTTSENGAAAISAGRLKEIGNPDNTVLRISYGGSIGRDYGLNGGFSYAGWQAGMNGIDARSFTHLAMRVRGENGGETPNIYLSDAVKRWPIRAKEMPSITQDWQTIRLPLEHYFREGIDLSHLDAMEMVFEWTDQSGTIYVDDIRFE